MREMITRTRRPISAKERLEIFDRAQGLCHLCEEKIDVVRDAWDIEHRVSLAMGGDETRGSDNLQPAHRDCHRIKSSSDSWALAKAKRREARHKGAAVSRSPLPGGRASKWRKKLDGTVTPR